MSLATKFCSTSRSMVTPPLSRRLVSTRSPAAVRRSVSRLSRIDGTATAPIAAKPNTMTTTTSERLRVNRPRMERMRYAAPGSSMR